VLYNFNVQAGGSWQNSFTQGRTYTITVDSIKYVQINGFNLKQLFVRYQSSEGAWGNFYAPTQITERLGCSTYLFNFLKDPESDGDHVGNFLCYQDSTFGLKQFTSKPCDYSDLVGLEEINFGNSSISIFPNPATEALNFKIDAPADKDLKIHISDVSGRRIEELKVNPGSDRGVLRIPDYKPGIYFISVFCEGKLVETKKLVVAR
jgi:hypothetical protein